MAARPPTGNDWLSDARAYFTALGPNQPWTRETIEARVRMAVEDGCSVLMCFVQDEGYALWPSRVVPVASRTNGLDVVGTIVEATHAAGLRFVAQWMGVHVQTVQMAGHPSWLQRDASGTAAAALCLNSPFGGYLLEQVNEVVRGYPVDALYFDGLYFRDGGCYCPYCAQQFEASYGRQLPAMAGSPAMETVGPGEHWLDFAVRERSDDPDLHTFRFGTVQGFLRRLRQIVEGARPGVGIVLDTLGVQGAFWPNAQDVAALALSVDAFALECYPDQIREPSWHVALETELVRAESRRPVWLLRWVSRDPDGDLVSVPAATVELHASTAIGHRAAPVAVEMNLLSVDDSLRPTIQRAFTDWEAAQKVMVGTEPIAYAGLLYSETTKRVVAGRRRSRSYFDALSGAWLALTEAHLPFVLITEADLASGRLPDDMRVVVLPNAIFVPDDPLTGLERFVARGGGLVATYRSGFGDEPDGRLAKLLGVSTAGVGFRSGRVGTESIGGQELVNYYRLGGGHPVLDGLEGRLFSFPGGYVRLLDVEGDILGRILDSDYSAMDGERWFGWYPGRDASPIGIARSVDAGRAVFFAAPLDAVFYRQGRPEAAKLLEQAVRWAAGDESPVLIEAPPSVEVNARRGSDGRLVVALANRTTNELYAIGAGVPAGTATSSAGGAGVAEITLRAQQARYIVPVADVVLRAPWMQSAAVTASALRSDALEVSVQNDMLFVRVPRLDAYEVISIESR